jgi:hypothetical protein
MKLEKEEEKREEEKPEMECQMRYVLLDEDGKDVAAGECRSRLYEENLTILPPSGSVLMIPYREILEISESDYQLHLSLSSKEKIRLSYLGTYYDDFKRTITNLRNEVLLKDLLMHETLKASDVPAHLVYLNEKGEEKHRGPCKARLYETGFVLILEKGDIIRVPFSDISEFSEQDFSLTISTEFEEKIVLSMMGQNLDPFKAMLSDLITALQLKVLRMLKEMLPSVDQLSLRKVARFMKEGRAARRLDVEAVNPKIWKELEKRVASQDYLKESYDFLMRMAQRDHACIGVKRGLMGDLTGEFIWFLIPIYDADVKELGNALAMETTTEGGHATYFFRITSRKDYPAFKSLEDLGREADKVIKVINRCMIDINFRREPIYLPDNALEEQRYFRYKVAVQKIPSLQLLRNLFIGRVIHATLDQWAKDVTDLLRFNVSTLDDSAKWHLQSITESTEVE